MSGTNILKDGNCIVECYGPDLDKLDEGDRVGVLRTSSDELIFFVNGESQGVAATNIPKPVWVVVNLYGKCTQVSVCSTSSTLNCETCIESATDIVQNIEIPLNVDISVIQNGLSALLLGNNSESLTGCDLVGHINGDAASGGAFDMNDRLHFHSRCGSLVNLSANNRTAERRRPLDEFNNGVVMTHRPLRDNELFEIRIDKLVDKWSGSIEVR